MTGSFNGVDGVDKYLLLYQEGKEITANPIDKTSYASGDNIGDAIVVEYYESDDEPNLYEFEIIDLPSATDFTVAVYAVNAFGTNGPAYNTVNPLTAVTYTNPTAPTAFEFTNVTDNTAVVNLTANELNNKVLVVYNSELVRDSYGDYALIGELSGEYVAGQEIEGGGIVAYFGDAAENIEITGLEHSKGYFFEAYSYDPTYGYSTDKVTYDVATIAHLPYTLDLEAVKRYNVPPGWTKNESGKFELPNSVNGYTTEENPKVLWCKSTTKDATNGVVHQLTSSPIMVDQRDAVVKFDFAMFYQPSRFLTDAYNVWNENDVFAVQVSTDGETFEDIVTLTHENNPQFVYTDTLKSLEPLEGELAQYEGEQIYIRIHWHLFNATFSPGTLILDNFVVEGREIPETPVVKVEDITHLSAKVAWRGAQENYEVAFAKSGEEFTTTIVEGATEMLLNDLEAETEYQVKVRGIAAENDYSYWSEIVTFTTNAWPECDAPTDLIADITSFAEDGIVTLSWATNEEHLSWDVRYRDANTTSWNVIENLQEPKVSLATLENGVTYLWNVRAYCIADRVTSWSAQSSFEIPTLIDAPTNLEAVALSDTKIELSWDVVEGASSYGIYCSGQKLGSTEYTGVVMQGFEANSTYCFTVTAIDAEENESAHSEQVCVTTKEVPTEIPAVPTNVVAELLSETEVRLTWDAVKNASSYGVYSAGQKLGEVNSNAAKINNLELDTEYCYTVTAINSVGESEHSEQVCITIVGVEEVATSFNIYPNPVNDVLFVEMSENIEEVSIYTITGVMVYNETVLSGNSIDVSELEGGIYIIKVRTENNEIVNRFVKK